MRFRWLKTSFALFVSDDSSSESDCESDAEGSTCSSSSDSEVFDVIAEIKRKKAHPDRLHEELWYNDPGQVSLCPLLSRLKCVIIKPNVMFISNYLSSPVMPYKSEIRNRSWVTLRHMEITVRLMISQQHNNLGIITHCRAAAKSGFPTWQQLKCSLLIQMSANSRWQYIIVLTQSSTSRRTWPFFFFFLKLQLHGDKQPSCARIINSTQGLNEI